MGLVAAGGRRTEGEGRGGMHGHCWPATGGSNPVRDQSRDDLKRVYRHLGGWCLDQPGPAWTWLLWGGEGGWMQQRAG